MAPFWEPRGVQGTTFFLKKSVLWHFWRPGDSRGPRSSQNGAPRLLKRSPRGPQGSQKGVQETLRHPKNGARTLQKVAEISTLPRLENTSKSCRHNEPNLTQNSDSGLSKWSPKDDQSCQNDAQDSFKSNKMSTFPKSEIRVVLLAHMHCHSEPNPKGSPRFARIRHDSPGLPRIRQDSLGFTRTRQDCQDSPGFARILQDSLGFARTRQDSPGLARIR